MSPGVPDPEVCTPLRRFAASFWKRWSLFAILRQVHNRQHPLEEDAARLLRQFIEDGIDEGLHQFYAVGFPQVSAAFHKLHFGSIASGSQERLDFFYRQPQASLELFVHNILPEHCPLLTPV